ncbi:MAG: cation-translocating P-type ATPase [Bacteroidales bacterium]
MYNKYKFDIEGMNCPSCSYRLQKHLKKMVGIRNASANLASASLSIEYDPEKISLSKIEEEVKAMGYQLTPDPLASNPSHFYERKLKRQALKIRSEGKRLIIAFVFFTPLLLAGLSPLLHYSLPEPFGFQQHPGHFALFELFLSIPILIIGWRFIKAGWKQLLILKPDINSLIALSVTASLGYNFYSLYYLIWENGLLLNYPLYFLPACAIILMSMLGHYVENRITAQSEQTLRQLFSILPDTAILEKDQVETPVRTEELQPGDLVSIKPANRIPVDGIVKKGMSMVDESVFTGSKTPLLRIPNDKVLAGMLNQEGYLTVEVQKTGSDTFLAEIIRLIEEGENSKPAIGLLADRVSSWVIQAILAIAFISAGLWIFFTHDYHFAFNVFISVLVIACPVAIGLAIPVSVLFATRKASSLSIMIRHISSFECIKKASTYVFNLTGTITRGIPTVTDLIANQNLSPEKLLHLAASAESLSTHPIALAILSDAREKNIQISHPDPVRELPGQGIEAVIDDIRVDIGNRKLMELINIDIEDLNKMSLICRDLATQGKSAVMIAVEGVLEGIIAVEDKPRPEARDIVRELQQKGYRVILLTGDHWNTARHIAQEVGITEVYGEIQPANRARFIRKLQHEGKSIVMIGDGLNDAGALAQADAGIAIGSPNDIAADAADIVLLNKDLRLLLVVQRLANKTMRNIKENLFFAFLYNLLMVPIAAGLFYLFKIHFLLDPLWAVTAMFLGTLSVLLNGFRLQRFKK